VAVNVVERQTRSSSYIKGSTSNGLNEGKTNNLGWMPILVYAGLSINSLSWHGRIQRNNIALYSVMMVELWT